MKELWKYFEKNDHDISIDECGIQHFFPSQAYAYNTYQNFIIHYIESGSGIYEVNDQRYELGAGDGFIIRRGTKVNYYANHDDPWKYYWVGLNGRHLDGYIKLTTLNSGSVIHFPEDSQSSKTIKDICVFTKDYFDTPNNMVWYKYKVYELIWALTTEFQDKDHTLELPQRNYEEVALDYIQSNYTKRMTITDVANYIGISRSYLYRLFKHKYEVSPQEYLQDKRLKTAKKLLQNQDLSVNEVAYSVGYDNQLLFSKNFKKKFGMSPTHYRQIINQKQEV
ncbi:AraC family transcriptional regulator [Fundicoccus culcitae]|uniref:AraC family transcriptional regulator n=1 Tax=Fundicoccus culcitae TaxID=2969821 RepID=A0ABY5P7R8_9LACT|nr:AraC family transcriptional regulator [Fundicoccus culcitae]UUX34761.1 AraC family transcriptional regulator [Fundicoccus culcitae]